jgi:hypothetical protein
MLLERNGMKAGFLIAEMHGFDLREVAQHSRHSLDRRKI